MQELIHGFLTFFISVWKSKKAQHHILFSRNCISFLRIVSGNQIICQNKLKYTHLINVHYHIKYVDPKKLEKVNEKAKKKLDKAEGRVDTSVQSNLSTYDSSKAASASQSISKKTEAQNESESNRNYDICIENFDVSFGNK